MKITYNAAEADKTQSLTGAAECAKGANPVETATDGIIVARWDHFVGDSGNTCREGTLLRKLLLGAGHRRLIGLGRQAEDWSNLRDKVGDEQEPIAELTGITLRLNYV